MNLKALPFLAAYMVCCPHLHPVWADDRQYELIIHTCLEMNPTNCTTHRRMVGQMPSNPSAAYRDIQAIVADFMKEHPGLVFKGFDLKVGEGA